MIRYEYVCAHTKHRRRILYMGSLMVNIPLQFFLIVQGTIILLG